MNSPITVADRQRAEHIYRVFHVDDNTALAAMQQELAQELANERADLIRAVVDFQAPTSTYMNATDFDEGKEEERRQQLVDEILTGIGYGPDA